MEIWIENKIGRLQGYSLMIQPKLVAVEVEREPTDFSNWFFDGNELVYEKQESIEICRQETLEEKVERLEKEIEELKQEEVSE